MVRDGCTAAVLVHRRLSQTCDIDQHQCAHHLSEFYPLRDALRNFIVVGPAAVPGSNGVSLVTPFLTRYVYVAVHREPPCAASSNQCATIGRDQ